MQPVRYRFFDQPAEIAAYLQSLHAEPELAIDLEADSLFSYPEKVCLVQISTRKANAILDPLIGGDGLGPLGALLADGAVAKVFHGGGYDIRLLKKVHAFSVQNVADTMIAAQLAGRAQIGLSALLEEEFGVRLQKKYQRANWSKRPLQRPMLRYAALDTAHLLPLWQRLRDELQRLGRLQWVREEFELLEDVEPAADGRPCWFDIKGARDLLPRQRVTLQALVDLREATARAWGSPPFKVLGNEVLLGWAQAPPVTSKEVLQTPRANKGILRRLASRVLHAVREARLVSPGDCPSPRTVRRTPMTDDQRRRLRRLKIVRSNVAEGLGLDVGLLVNSASLAKLARAEPAQVPVLLTSLLKSWQQQVIGEALLQAVRG